MDGYGLANFFPDLVLEHLYSISKAAPRQQNSYRTFVPQPGHQTAKGLTWWSFAQIEHMLSRASSEVCHCFLHSLRIFLKIFLTDESPLAEFVNLTVDAAEVDSLKVQHAFAKKWLELDPNAGEVKIVASIEEAIQAVRQLAAGKAPSAAGKGNHQPDQVQALVTGSIHLIGGALEILEGDAKTL